MTQNVYANAVPMLHYVAIAVYIEMVQELIPFGMLRLSYVSLYVAKAVYMRGTWYALQ